MTGPLIAILAAAFALDACIVSYYASGQVMLLWSLPVSVVVAMGVLLLLLNK